MSGTSYGYKNTSGTFVAFRKPTGTATAAQVLSGYSFSNASSDGLNGSIPVRSNGTAATSTGKDSHGPYVYFPYGYYSQVSTTYGSYVYLTAAQVNAMGGGSGYGTYRVVLKCTYGIQYDVQGTGYCYVDVKVSAGKPTATIYSGSSMSTSGSWGGRDPGAIILSVSIYSITKIA